MTTTTKDPLAVTLRKTGETITLLPAASIKTAMIGISQRKNLDAFVVNAKNDEGAGTYGVYVELLLGESRIIRHTRYFVYGDTVYASTRTVGQAKFSTWKSRKYTSTEHALNILQDAMNRANSQMYGRVTLVEMKPDDISAVEAGQVPGARYRGQHRVERDFGRYDFEGEIRNEEMPESLKHRLAGR